MFTRFRDSLIYPEEIINFRKDSIFRVFFHIFIFALIMSLFVIIDTINFQGVNIATEDYIKEQLYVENIPCDTDSYVLSCDSDQNILLLPYGDLLDFYLVSQETIAIEDYQTSRINIVVYEDRVYLNVYSTTMDIPLDSLEGFSELDLRNIENNPQQFQRDFIDIIDTYLINNRTSWATSVIGIYVFLNFLLAIFVALITAMFFRARYKFVRFKEAFKIGAYLSSGTLLVFAFMNMLGNELFFIILVIIINSRQNGRLAKTMDLLSKQ